MHGFVCPSELGCIATIKNPCDSASSPAWLLLLHQRMIFPCKLLFVSNVKHTSIYKDLLPADYIGP